MVRAHIKHPSDDKDKRRSLSKAVKQASPPPPAPAPAPVPIPAPRAIHVDGVWICKLHNCNNAYAREADLKRHQRTSKLHVQGDAKQCPQCQANFTRLDALRRHQKSRHNGVVMSPSESNSTETLDDDESMPNTPSSADCVQTYTRYSETTESAQSYYRAHLGSSTNTSAYQTSKIPTSEARLHSWNPPWSPGDEMRPKKHPLYPDHYSSQAHYTPGVYYRTSSGEPAVPAQPFLPPGLRSLQGAADNVEAPTLSSTLSRSSDIRSETVNPSLRGGSQSPVSPRQHRTRTSSSQKAGLGESGLNPDVQQAVEAVLSISPRVAVQGMDSTQPSPLSPEEAAQPMSAVSDSSFESIKMVV